MSNRFLASMAVLTGLISVVSLAHVTIQGQARSAAPNAKATTWTPPLTPDGQPDLQGVWSYATLTPLERPESLAGKAFLTAADATEFEKQQAGNRIKIDDAPLPPGQVGGYNQFWYESGTKVVADKRTALVVDPPDGRLPPLTPEAQKRADAHWKMLKGPAAGPEDRDASERCILGYNAGPPMVPGGYNQNVQVIQTRDYVVLHTEMVHDARIIPLDGRPHLPQHFRPWSGDSRGHWEGQTLVVETTNFSDKTWNQFNRWNMASDENMHLVERFTGVDADTLRYEFTIDDPTTWTKSWTAVNLLTKTEGQMYEYACHEGNYGMVDILRGDRLRETGGADKGATKGASVVR
jgi:hypothetical protein